MVEYGVLRGQILEEIIDEGGRGYELAHETICQAAEVKVEGSFVTQRRPSPLLLPPPCGCSPLSVCQVLPRQVAAEEVHVTAHEQRHQRRAKPPNRVEVPHVEVWEVLVLR